jgi:hypothetical protein
LIGAMEKVRIDFFKNHNENIIEKFNGPMIQQRLLVRINRTIDLWDLLPINGDIIRNKSLLKSVKILGIGREEPREFLVLFYYNERLKDSKIRSLITTEPYSRARTLKLTGGGTWFPIAKTFVTYVCDSAFTAVVCQSIDGNRIARALWHKNVKLVFKRENMIRRSETDNFGRTYTTDTWSLIPTIAFVVVNVEGALVVWACISHPIDCTNAITITRNGRNGLFYWKKILVRISAIIFFYYRPYLYGGGNKNY